MATGTVKWFDNKRGVGFIREDSGLEIFVDMNAVQLSGLSSLQKDQKLSFDVHKAPENSKAPAARNIKAISHD